MKKNLIQRELKIFLQAKGWEVYAADCVAVGFPDVLALKEGAAIYIAIKVIGGDYRPSLDKWIAEHDAVTVFTLEEIEAGWRLWNLGVHITFETLLGAVEWMV